MDQSGMYYIIIDIIIVVVIVFVIIFILFIYFNQALEAYMSL